MKLPAVSGLGNYDVYMNMIKICHIPMLHRVASRLRVIGVLMQLLLILAPIPASAATLGYPGKIAFQSNLSGKYQIYTMNSDGTNVVNVSNSSANDYAPDWSPDGSRIVFHSDRDGNQEVYVMNADGSNQVRLTKDPAADGYATWSPDGTKIAFRTNRLSNQDVWIMNADGSNPTRLTTATGIDTAPDWSTKGDKITFWTNRDGNQEIYSMNPDGSEQTNLSNASTSNEVNSSWTPDDRYIFFISNRNSTSSTIYDIFRMNRDGSNQVAITHSASISEENPDISPDGRRLTYKSNATGNYEIYTMNLDGSGAMPLTNNGANNAEPDWQPIPNIPPAVADDSALVPLNTPTFVDVLSNDGDEEALPGTNLSIVVAPAHGSASITNGQVRYVPTSGYQGNDQLTYRICDAFTFDQKCASGIVRFMVQAPPAPLLTVARADNTPYVNVSIISSYTPPTVRPTSNETVPSGLTTKVESHPDPVVIAAIGTCAFTLIIIGLATVYKGKG